MTRRLTRTSETGGRRGYNGANKNKKLRIDNQRGYRRPKKGVEKMWFIIDGHGFTFAIRKRKGKGRNISNYRWKCIKGMQVELLGEGRDYGIPLEKERAALVFTRPYCWIRNAENWGQLGGTKAYRWSFRP